MSIRNTRCQRHLLIRKKKLKAMSILDINVCQTIIRVVCRESDRFFILTVS